MRNFFPCLLALCAALVAAEPLKLFTFGQQGARRSGEALGEVALTAGRPGGFYRPNNNLPLKEIAQFEAECLSSAPVRLRLSASLIQGGKRISASLPPVALAGDGQYHRIVFELTDMPHWAECDTLGDMELRFVPETAGAAPVIAFRNARFAKREKAAPPLKLFTFGQQGARRSGEALDGVALTAGRPGGFFRPNNNLPLKSLAFFEIECRSSAAVRLRLASSLLKDGKRLSTALPPVPLAADAEYQRVAFDLTRQPHWGECERLVDLELRFTPDEAGAAPVIAFRNARFTSRPTPALEFRGAALGRAVHLSRLAPSPSDNAVEAMASAGVAGCFHQQGLEWDAETVKQIEFRLKADAPGYWHFDCSNLADGKRHTVRVLPVAAIPDGEWHDLVIDLAAQREWRGVMTNYELKWAGGEPARLGLAAVRAKTLANRIPDAENASPGRPIPVAHLDPRAECRLAWEGGVSPGATLHFRGGDLRELAGTAVALPKGAREVRFTVPEMAAEAWLEIAAKGTGFPVVQQLRYTPPAAAGRLFWRGKWLWMQNAPGPVDRSIWFQRDFDLEEAPQAAFIAAAGDDSCYTYVNGRFVGKTRRWSQTARYDITRLLRPGKNRISCRVKNIDSWGGFLADVYVRTAKGDLFLDTDEKWRCETKTNTDRTIPEADEPVVVLGDARIPPWKGGMLLRYAGPQGLLAPVKLEPGRMTVRVERMPPDEIKSLRFVTVDEQGRKLDFTLPVTPGSAQWKEGAEVAIRYPVPYHDRGKCRIFLEDDSVAIVGNPPVATLDKGTPTPPPLRRASWTGGPRPMLQFGDERIQPIFWQAPSTYGRNFLAGLPHFADNNFRSYRISASFQDYWKPDGTFDFSIFDKEVANLLTLKPDAVFAIQIYSFMPEWWLARNPDDLSRHYQGRPRDLWLDKQALASQKWLTEGEIPLKALIDHIKASGYADRVWGLSFTENNCGEWFWTSADANGQRSYAGYSPADYASYRAFLKRRYQTDEALAKAWGQPGLTFATVEMPYLEKARKGTVGTLLDAEKDRAMIDFFEFRSLALAEAIIHFGKFTKQETDGKWLVGAYYGYFSEMIANPRRNIQSNGHNGFLETARSPYVDFVHAPLRYTVRKTGQPGTMMQTWDTWTLHGKMIFTELDVRTSLGAVKDNAANIVYCGTPSVPLYDIGQFTRSFGMAAATGTSLYWYDLAHHQFDEKVLNRVISDLNDLYLKLPPVQGTTPCEVAVVSDRDSAWRTQFPAANSPNTIAAEALFHHFNELAVPFRSLTVSDLLDETIQVPPHKCYVMLTPVMLSRESRARLMQRFQREGASVVWLYAAGASYPERGPQAAFNGDFLGLQCRMELEEQCPVMTTTPEWGAIECRANHATAPIFVPVAGFDQVLGRDAAERPLMVLKRLGGSAHYFTALPNLPTALYARILDRAAVRRYRKEPGRDQYWIGNDLLFLHAATNGDKRLALPRGLRARAIAGPFQGTLRDGDAFPARAGMTYGFLVERE